MFFFTIITLFIVSLVIVLIFLFSIFFTKEISFDVLHGRHVLITGGSKGIGWQLALLCVSYGANVTIVARDPSHLDRCKIELIKKSNFKNQKILAFSLDVSEDLIKMEQAFEEAENISGPIFILACCAGTAISRTFVDSTIDQFQSQMNVNYFGTVNTIKACLPSLKRNNNQDSHLLLFSSLAGIFGLYGYSAYSPSKFALIGLAQVLAMEFRPYKINLTVAMPPDTNTPGFEQEEKGKPLITKLISKEGGLFEAKDVASKSLKDCLRKEFLSTSGLNGFVLSILCSGMMPTRSRIKQIIEISTMGLFRLIALFFLDSCNQIIDKHHESIITENLKDTITKESKKD
ncbi:GH20346 [Sarcoptes scabiei]|nr:GH20346 [Sarcoptes scabiei]